jgi:PKD repeat protein
MLVACLTGLLAGCPWRGDNGLALLLTPQVLNFEDDQDSLLFQVHRNLTNSPVEPVVVSSNQPWIVLDLCTDTADNCLGFGIVDQLYIPVRVDRNQMLLGTNRGEVIVRTGGAGDQKITVYAEDVLQVDFLVNNRRPATGQAVSFQDASEKTDDAGDIVSRLWDFGDGNTSTATDPVHVYDTPGLYSVSLTVTTANSEETIRKAAWITVGSPSPMVDFEVDKTNIYEGESILFTDLSITATEPVTGVLWDFGDGRTSTETRPSHQYTQPGVFSVSLTVSTANASETKTKNNLIVVQRKLAPVARIAVNPASPVALAPARFSDISDAGSAEIQQWFWDFGDGATSSVQHPTHTFAAGGTYDVSLYVVSAHGSNTVTTSVTVITIPPTAAFTISDSTPFILTPVTFTDASTDGSAPIEQYNWEFGDGASSTEKNPVHTYNSAGTFAVRLTVISDHGSDSTTQSVTVSFMPPVANFSGTPRSPSVGQAVQFQDLSRPGTAAVNQWLWDFGDPDSEEDNLSNLQNPTHVYNAPGFYTVTLTVRTPVTTDNSDTEIKTAYIQVVQAPEPDFSFTVTSPNTPNILQFTNETVAGSEPIIATLWNFGDPGSGVTNTSQAANPTHEFSTEGNFTVTLTVQTATREVSVAQVVPVFFNPPTVDFTVETVETTPREDVLTSGALTTDTLQFLNLTTPGTETDPVDFSYAWDFGDGNSSTLEEPTHTYDSRGTFTVVLTVTTPTSVTTASYDVAIDVPPVPDFGAVPTIANVNADINFFDNSNDAGTQPIEGRLWNFGDSFISVDENPTHAYAAAGSYDVTLTLSFTHAITGEPMTISVTKLNFISINP